MSTTLFLLYLLSAFCVAILSVRFISHYYSNNHSHTSLHRLYASRTDHVWPELKLNWRLAIATVIGFLGSAFGTVGGVGGGGIFVPVLTLVVGFDTKSAAALSKCMIMGASASSVCYNVRVAHPMKAVAILDYHLALLFQPMLMLGVSLGVSLSVVFPYWLITLLVVILFISTSSRSFCKGAEMWRQETLLKQEFAEQQATLNNSPGELQIDTTQPLIPKENMPTMQILRLNLRWKWILTLTIAWVCFLLLQVIKNDVEICSAWYWVLFYLQFPVAIMVYGYEAVKLYREHKKRKSTGNPEMICEATIEWSALSLAFCAFCGILGGTVGGLLGSGGGFILGPLLLEIGVIPQVASATATFVMMFSSSLSVVEFYLLKRFPIPYALYLTAVSVLAGFCGQFFVRKLITIIGRASIIVFILSGVIFASALTMGVVGIEQSIQMIHEHEFMGFLEFCESQ